MVDLVGVLCAGALILCAWKVLDWLWWKPKRLERYFREQGIEGPSYKLIHGNLREDAVASMEAIAKPMKSFSHAIAPRIFPFLHQSVEKYGKVSLFWVGGTPKVNIMDPDLVRDVLTNKSGHFFQVTANPYEKVFVTGLVGINGEKWAKHRKIINPAFHLEKLKLMLPAFRSSSEELIDNWKKLGLEGSFELDVVPAFERLTSDAISKTAFGSNYEQGKQLFEFQAEQLQIVFQSYESAYIPGARYLPTKANKRLNYLDDEIRTILRGMIKKREEAINLGGVRNQDLLSLLVESNLRETHENKNVKGGAMSVDDIVEECKVFYFAGRETTSDLLVWTIVLLSMHQEWQERAREEVLRAFGTNKPDFDGLNHLKIVSMILNEVLRLYPPFSMLIRYTNRATKLGEINLPQGVLVGLPVLSLHHDRKIWGEDAEEFNPARFSGGVANATKGKASFFTFGWGPRICIGQQFALLEAKIAVTMILQHFSFELSPTYVHSPYSLVTIQPQYGAPIVFHKL